MALRRKGRATVLTDWSDELGALAIANACKGLPSLTPLFVVPLDSPPTSALDAVCQMQQPKFAESELEGGGTHVVFLPSDEAVVAGIVREVGMESTVRRQYAATRLDGYTSTRPKP